MKTVSEHVEDKMRESPFISKLLRIGLFNYKALARYMEPEISATIGEKVSVGAIAVALQRLHYRDKDKLINLIGRLRGVKVISNISVFRAPASVKYFKLLAALESDETLDAPFFAVIRADTDVVLVMEKFVREKFLALGGSSDYKEEDVNLTGLVITRERVSGQEVAGISYPLLVLSENGIDAKAVSATHDEEIILVEEAVADRAAAILRHAMWR